MSPYEAALYARDAYSGSADFGSGPCPSPVVGLYTPSMERVWAFRGTTDLNGWLHDFDLTTVFVPGLGELDRGFYNAAAQLLPAFAPCRTFTPSALVGHSLGAAVALIVAACFALDGLVVPTFALEPPRLCADSTLARLLHGVGTPVFACRNGNDVVTELPPALEQPFPLVHVGTPSLPFPNTFDHHIDAVVAALKTAYPPPASS